MENPKRTWEDIKEVRIFADKIDTGWVAEIVYKDNKSATFSIDYGGKNEDMLYLTYDSIKRQIHG